MYLKTNKGIIETPKKRPLKVLFCRHRHIIIGDQCSQTGTRRIFGSDTYVVCTNCGKILTEFHIDW